MHIKTTIDPRPPPWSQPAAKIWLMASLALALSACGSLPEVQFGADDDNDKSKSASAPAEQPLDASPISAELVVSETETQSIVAADDHVLAGTRVEIPPGTVAMEAGASVTLTPSPDLSDDWANTELTSGTATPAGPAVNFSLTNASLTGAVLVTFALNLPEPQRSAALADPTNNLAIAYSTTTESSLITRFGALPGQAIVTDKIKGTAQFFVRFAGTFQLMLVSEPVTTPDSIDVGPGTDDGSDDGTTDGTDSGPDLPAYNSALPETPALWLDARYASLEDSSKKVVAWDNLSGFAAVAAIPYDQPSAPICDATSGMIQFNGDNRGQARGENRQYLTLGDFELKDTFTLVFGGIQLWLPNGENYQVLATFKAQAGDDLPASQHMIALVDFQGVNYMVVTRFVAGEEVQRRIVTIPWDDTQPAVMALRFGRAGDEYAYDIRAGGESVDVNITLPISFDWAPTGSTLGAADTTGEGTYDFGFAGALGAVLAFDGVISSDNLGSLEESIADDWFGQ